MASCSITCDVNLPFDFSHQILRTSWQEKTHMSVANYKDQGPMERKVSIRHFIFIFKPPQSNGLKYKKVQSDAEIDLKRELLEVCSLEQTQ